VSRYGKNLPKQGRGKPIKASDLNAVRTVAEGLSRQQIGGVLAQTTIAGVPMSLAGEGTIISKAIIEDGHRDRHAPDSPAGRLACGRPHRARVVIRGARCGSSVLRRRD
jgi:hypothetical protein